MGKLTDGELREALLRENTLAQLPALIMANIEDVPEWQDSAALVTAHCHARVLHEDIVAALSLQNGESSNAKPGEGTSR